MLSFLLVGGPDLSSDDHGIWTKHCIVSFTKPWYLSAYLLLDMSAKHALVDLIAFLPDIMGDSHPQRSRAVIDDVRALPESCCMRDGRKWKRIPCVVLCESEYEAGAWCLREARIPTVQFSTVDNYWHFDRTLKQLQNIVDKYQERVLEGYQQVGILVDYERGRYRVKWAYQQRDPDAENEYYYAPADRRKLKDYITVHRDVAGIAYEAKLFEELINAPETRERDLQRFLEQHPAFLMDAMQGIPISHRPRFARPKAWTPDFVVPPVATLDGSRSVELTELKGVHAPLLTGKQHRAFSHNVMAAINQVRDYNRVLRERHPANVKTVLDTFGYMPEKVRMAVVIGRAPTTRADRETLERRMGEQPDVRIVPYDEILQVQQSQIEVSIPRPMSFDF